MRVKYIAIMLTRPLCILIAQIGLALLLGSWTAAFPWWPFQMIAANIICFAILRKLTSQDGEPFRNLYLRPFGSGLVAGKLGRWLGPRRFERRALTVLRDVGLFAGFLLVLGLPAIAAARLIETQISTAMESWRYGPLPLWALLAVTLLLPLTMPLVEVPWYFGYFFPKLERLRVAAGKRHAWASALVITTAAYAVQHCFQPFLFDARFLALRAVMLLPLLLLTAVTLRAVPRFMPYVLVLHALMAVEVVWSYWRSA